MPLNNWTIAITILLTAGALLSVFRYARTRQLPAAKKTALITLRVFWIAGLVISFWEPMIRFERFETGRVRIPVLIDASISMQNFAPEASVLPLLDTLAALQSRTEGRVSFEYFLFGDSTREYKPDFPLSANTQSGGAPAGQGARTLFTDAKSVFPITIDDGGERFSDDMIIITDGHWTRPRRSSEVFPRNTIYYYVLPDAAPTPFVTITYDAPETAPVDSQFTVSVTASGFASEASALTISLKEKERVVRTETVSIDEEGFFTRSVRFRTANSRPGRKLYSVEASLGAPGDTSARPAASSFVHQTIPHFFTYSIYSATPTLDRRYMTQALLSDKNFRPRASSPDLLFLFDWDSTAAQSLRRAPGHGVAVFMGCLPCNTTAVNAPSISVRQVDNTITLDNMDIRSMPPPQMIFTCAQMPVSNIRRMLTASVNTASAADSRVGRAGTTGGTGSAAVTDNVQILFSGKFRGTQALFSPARGTWRWDFWPMATDRAENELFGFSNTILSIVKELLLDNISDQLIIYPAADLYETDSAKFFMSLPAAVPIFEMARLSVQIQGDGVSIDTTMDYRPTGLNRQPLTLAPLPPGRYSISSTLTRQGIRAAFADSVTVNKDMSELSVLAQNTRYLQEFAQPLDMNEPASAAVFEAWERRSAERGTVTEIMHIRRSWTLLGIVLLLLMMELILRRRWEMD